MDPVSRLLIERERSLPRLLPWAAAAFALHAAVAIAVAVAARSGPSRRVHLPAVSVRIVRPEPRPAARSGPPSPAPAAVSTPAPRATAKPRPTAPPATPKPSRKRTAVPERAPSADAMAAPHSTPAPPPTPAPEPTSSGSGGGGGLALAGGADSSSQPALPSDFQFTFYVERMLALIESNWYKPPVPRGTRALVRFRITTAGRLEAIELEESSGVPSFDRSALRALYAANPLPPLPPAYGKPSVTVHLAFSE